MLIRLFSDLHNEFGGYQGRDSNPFYIPELDTDKDTTLVLCGDIDVGGKAIDYANSFSERFRHIVLIAGNHDYWGTTFNLVPDKWKSEAYPNVYPLFNESIILDGALFVGGTMWTNYNNYDPLAMYMAKDIMRADHQKISAKRPNGTFGSVIVETLYNEHFDFVRYLEHVLVDKCDMKVVVCTHHSPSYMNSNPSFAGTASEHYYHSNLDDLIQRVDLWCFGHTHYNVDHMIGDTRVVCNQRGYFEKEEKGFDKYKVIDLY